jgi:hypothetical protein
MKTWLPPAVASLPLLLQLRDQHDRSVYEVFVTPIFTGGAQRGDAAERALIVWYPAPTSNTSAHQTSDSLPRTFPNHPPS